MTINEKIQGLEDEILALRAKVDDLSKNLEEKSIQPYSKVGTEQGKSHNRPVEPVTGLGGTFGGNLPFNDSELKIPPYGSQPSTPTKGYNKHGHSRYAGGALDINTLELVEYETDEEGNILDTNGNILNKHSQQFWTTQGKIKIVQNSKDENINKIGNLDITFDPETSKWKAGVSEIDVETTMFVKKVDGQIEEDENGNPKSSPLYNADIEKSSVIWDKDNQVWRFFAVYA